MSTQTPVVERPPPGPAAEPPDPMERFIDQRLEQARRHVKGVDLAAGLMTLLVGVLVYTLLVSVLDHWVVYGGLGFWGRLLAFGLLVAGAGWFAARQVLPPLVKRINPVFAAHTLEQSRPSIKNSLINFLLLRTRRRDVSRVIYRALEQRAVTDLRQVEIEAAVDRRHVLRLGYVLAGTFAVFCLYLILSPKSPMISAARLFAPWADIPAPSRVRFEQIEPGDAVVFQGDFQTVTAEVRGELRPGEEVLLHYTTADGQSVDQVVPLVKDAGDYRHRCNLPPGSRGFQQDWQYRLSAGDALSRWFDIRVEVPPVIEVESVRYDYPAYTGLAPRTVARQGDLRPQADIRAVEGTRVTIQGRANRSVERAEIDLGCDGRGSVAMRVEEQSAVGGFQLRFNRNDPSRPQYDCYQLRFIDQQGHWNPRPVRYEIDVIADLPPRVEILAPEQDVIRLAPDAVLPVRVRAEDPDYALRQVVLRTSRDGRALRELPLLARPTPQSAWEGPFEGTVEFRPDRLGLGPGDVVMLWAEAEDNKEPSPNVAASARRRIEIIGEGGVPTRAQPGEQQGGAEPQAAQPSEQADSQPDGPQPGQPPGEQPEEPPSAEPGQEGAAEQQPQPGEPGAEPPGGAAQQPQQGPQGAEGASGQSGQGPGPAEPGTPPGASSPSQPQPGQPGAEPAGPSQPIDPEANPGDAFEQILEHRQEELAQRDQGNSGAEQPGADQGVQQQQPEAQPGSQQTTGQQQPEAQPGSQQTTGQQQPEAQPGSQQDTGQQQPGAQPGSQQDTGQQQPGAQPGSQQGTGEQQPGAQPGSQQDTGQQQPGTQPEAQPGSQQDTGQQQPGTQPEAQPGSQQDTGQQQPGAQPGSQQGTGEQQPGSQQDTGQQQPGAQPGSPQGAGQQQPGAQPGAQPGSQQETSQQPGTQPQEGSPGGSPPSGGTQQGESPGESQPSGSGGEPQAQPQSPGQGEPSQGSGGTTSPQEGNRERPKEPGQSGQGGQSQQPEGSAQSPSTSPHQSDSSSDTGGDRSGGGEQGGGQQAPQPGQGSPGSQSPADSGGGASAEPGQGPTGPGPGDQVPSTQPTGRSADRQSSDGSGTPTGEPGQGSPPPGSAAERAPDSGQPGGPEGQPSDGQSPGSRPGPEPGSHGWGNPTSGGSPGTEPPGEPQPGEAGEPGARLDPDMEFARRQTALALEHLKEQMDEQDSELFERLGWDREQARRFLEQWEAMQRAAAGQGAEGQAARQRLNEALKSLGLRPRGLELGGGQSQVQEVPQLREGGRFEPPPEWSEQVREYLRGIAEGGR